MSKQILYTICPVLTKASVARQLLIDLFHTLNVYSAGFGMVDHRLRVVRPNDTLSKLLYTFWCIPRVIDVFGRKTPQYRQIPTVQKKIQIFICFV